MPLPAVSLLRYRRQFRAGTGAENQPFTRVTLPNGLAFKSVAGMAFRGTGRSDYGKLVERVRRILQDENGN